MKQWIQILILVFFVSCQNTYKNETEYQDADLLFRYIDDSLKNEITASEYVLTTFRVKDICSNCRGDIELSVLFDSVSSLYPGTSIYLVTDDDLFENNDTSFIEFQRKYPHLESVIVEDAVTMQRYGLYGSYPSIFKIENNTLMDARRYMKKDCDI